MALLDNMRKALDQANQTTGKSDTTLAAGIKSLIAGYGTGSGTGGKPEQAKTVKYTSNGTRTVFPDPGNTLSEVKVTVEVPTSGNSGPSLPDMFTPGDFPIQSIPAPSLSGTTAGEATNSTKILVKKAGDYKIKAIVQSINRDSAGGPQSSVRMYHGREGSAFAIGAAVKPASSPTDSNAVIEQTAYLADGESVWLEMTPGQYSQLFGSGKYTNQIVCLSLSLCIDWDPII